jgi:hypothetical protein
VAGPGNAKEIDMKSLLAAAATAIVVLAATPVLAQTVVTIYGGRYVPDTAPRPFYNDDYVFGRQYPGDNFDPAAAAINALNASNFWPKRGRATFNIDRAFTLNATGDSILEHQLKCQAAYSSYDLVSDTYIAGNGIPRPCRL